MKNLLGSGVIGIAKCMLQAIYRETAQEYANIICDKIQSGASGGNSGRDYDVYHRGTGAFLRAGAYSYFADRECGCGFPDGGDFSDDFERHAFF